MVCLGLEPGVAGWKAQTNPLSYGGTPDDFIIFQYLAMYNIESLSKIITQFLQIRLKNCQTRNKPSTIWQKFIKCCQSG